MTPPSLTQVKAEKNQWEELYSGCSRSLSSMGIDKQTFMWALTCVRSRSFAGPHFSTPVKLKLGLFAALQALIAFQVLMHDISAPADPSSLTASGGFDLVLLLAEALALAVPVAWAANDFKLAQSAVQYAICPFIDFLNHSSHSKVCPPSKISSDLSSRGACAT